MERRSAAEEARTEATNPNEQTPGTEPRRTRAQMDRHNEYCKRSRAKAKRRLEELEHTESKYLEMEQEVKQIRTEFEREKMERKRAEFKISSMQKEMRSLRRDLQEFRQILIEQQLNLENYFLSPINEDVGQVSGTSATVVHDANQLPRLGATGTDNIYQLKAFGASSAANHGLPFVSDASDNHDNGVLINSAVGSSSGANQYLPAFDAPNICDNLFTDNLAAGVLRNSAAGSSFQANHDPSIRFDATNNPENIQNPGFRF